MSRHLSALAQLLLLLSISACSGPEPAPPPPAPADAAAEEPLPPMASDAAVLDTLAWHLAGLVPEPTLAHPEVWTRHRAVMTAFWSKLEESRLRPLSLFAGEVLSEVADGGRPLLHPFAGSDFLTASILFPAAKTYVLIGEAGPGDLPDPASLDAESLGAELGRLVEALETRTAGEGRLDSVLALLLVDLARSGQVPLKVRYAELADDGIAELETVPPEAATPGGAAVRIDFAARRGGKVRSLTYLSQDLSNGAFQQEAGLYPYLRSLKPLDLFLRGTSYELHGPDHSTVAELLETYASNVLQDDTGLPHRTFPRQVWDLSYFGGYDLEPGDEHFQGSLQKAFSEDGVEPLTFGEGGLILARRRGQDLE